MKKEKKEKKEKLKSRMSLSDYIKRQEKSHSIDFYKRRSELYKKKYISYRLQLSGEKGRHLGEMRSLRNLQEEQMQVLENQIGRLENLIGIMKTGRIKYETTVESPCSENLRGSIDDGLVEKVSGVLFLQEIQQVEVRPDHVLLVTNSGREIRLGKAYDYLQNIFSIK